MNKKGQAAMEFLMTYGWAIVVVLAAIGALAYFGVLSPNKLLPDRTTFTAPLPNVDNAVISLADGTIEIAFRNNKGVAIQIPRDGTFISDQCQGSPITNSDAGANLLVTDTAGADIGPAVDIQNGAGFLINWACTPVAGSVVGSKFKAEISCDYVNSETGQTIKQTGTVEGKFS